MRSIGVIMNPVAGAGRARLSPEEATRLLKASGFDPEIFLTRLAGGAGELAAQAADRHEMVAVAGGDGTISEASRGLVGRDVALVVLPSGSGNDFAFGLGIKSPAEGIKAAVNGRKLEIDVCHFAGRDFINTCGLFFDGEVSLRAANVSRRWGNLRYTIATASLIGKYPPKACHFGFPMPDGSVESLDGRWFLAEIGNLSRCGGGFLLTPEADPTDGLMDFCLVREMSWPKFLATLPRALNGSHLRVDGVLYRKAAAARIMVPEPLTVHWDGEAETLPPGEHDFNLSRKALNVMIPAGDPK